jgi:hypothetical protein
MYQRKLNKIIDIIISCELSEPMNATTINTNDADNRRSNVPEKYSTLRQDLERILIAYSTPEIKFFGVSEIYEINYTLNQYGLMLKRSLYRLFITVAIMDSIGTRLGTQMSYMQHMTDMVVAIFNIKLDEPDSDDESESESESES